MVRVESSTLSKLVQAAHLGLDVIRSERADLLDNSSVKGRVDAATAAHVRDTHDRWIAFIESALAPFSGSAEGVAPQMPDAAPGSHK